MERSRPDPVKWGKNAGKHRCSGIACGAFCNEKGDFPLRTLIITTAFALVMSTGAMAQDSQVKELLAQTFAEESIEMDTSLLSDELANEIYALVQGSDQTAERSLIEQKLRENGFIVMNMEAMEAMEGDATATAEATAEPMMTTMVFEGNQLRDEVDIKLTEVGYSDVDTAALTDEQVTELYLVLQNTGDADRAEIDAILGM